MQYTGAGGIYRLTYNATYAGQSPFVVSALIILPVWFIRACCGALGFAQARCRSRSWSLLVRSPHSASNLADAERC